MAFSLTSDMDTHKELPAYKPLLKTILKSQIQLLVNQLSEYGDEECVLLTASMSDFSLSHIGSKYGHSFLTRYRNIKPNFLNFCIEKKRDLKPCQQSTAQLSGPANQGNVHKRHTISQIPGSKRFKPQAQATHVSNDNVTATANVLAIHKDSEEDSTSRASEQSGKDKEKMDHQQDANETDDKNIDNQEILGYKISLNDSSGNELNMDSENHTDSEAEIKIDDIIVKIEPVWDGHCQDGKAFMEDNCNTEESIDIEEKYNIDVTDTVSESTESNGIAGTTHTAANCDRDVSSKNSLNGLNISSSTRNHSSGIKEAYLQPEFLCCNDNLIWEKNYLPKRKRTVKTASLWRKYSAIKEVEEKKKSKAKIAKEYGIPSSTLSTWLKVADQIKADIEEKKIDPNKKKRRFSKFYDIETALLEWLKIVHMQAVIPKITSVNICDKANQLAKQFGYTSETFQCSKGWVERFKMRHGFNKNFVKGDNCYRD